MTKTAITREQLLALLQGDDAMRARVPTIVQEVLEAEKRSFKSTNSLDLRPVKALTASGLGKLRNWFTS
jgi:hypothetical protein